MSETTLGTYIGAKLAPGSQHALIAWCRSKGMVLSTLLNADHATIVFSRVPVLFPTRRFNPMLEVSPEGFKLDVFGNPNGTYGGGSILVLRFESTYLRYRWEAACRAGATWDFEAYNPHVSLAQSRNTDFSQVRTAAPPDFPIWLTHEYEAVLEFGTIPEEPDRPVFHRIEGQA